MIIPTLMLYSARTAPRWLRQAALGVDEDLAALCRQHWQTLRAVGRPSMPATVGIPERAERRPRR
ncbi:MAG TPA: hypothetical protein VLV25_11650 [Steroidobacteraceae bacterium]|nr:hypothetical protein [Steroidobacteraceae bacterium]